MILINFTGQLTLKEFRIIQLANRQNLSLRQKFHILLSSINNSDTISNHIQRDNMTLFDRIEKKIFFRIVRVVTFGIAFLALIATIAGFYAALDSTFEAKASKVTVSKDEINQVIKASAPAATTPAPTGTEVSSVTPPTEPVLSPEEKARKDIAKSIATKIFKTMGIEITSPDYKERLESLTNGILGDFASYDQETAISVLSQIDELAGGFSKATIEQEYNAARILFFKKYQHEQDLVTQKNMANEIHKMQGAMAFGSGIVVFALFVMILVLMRIEKNTRPIDSEDETFTTSDKKIFLSIIGIGVAIAVFTGWLYTHNASKNEEFNAVDEATQSMPMSNLSAPAAQEPATPSADPVSTSDAAAPAAEEADSEVDNNNIDSEQAQ